MGKIWIFGLMLIASIIGTAMFSVSAQTPQPKQLALPLSLPQAEYYGQHPQELQQFVDRLSQAAQQFTPGRKLAPGQTPSPGSWTTLNNSPGVSLQNPLLMTDGTVIAMAPCSGHWYKLTPDNTGSYVNGTWTQIASLPSGYAPLFVGSGVLPDGRVIVEGGEYNGSGGSCGSGAWTTKGAIYDPVANAWTAVTPPNGWSTIGDAAGIVLDNGTYMQSNCCDLSGSSGLSALLNPNTLTWTPTGSAKLDRWDEEGVAKLQNGNLLVVDAHTNTSCTNTSEIYSASTGTFSPTGNTVDQEPDCSNPGNNPSFELGPVVTRQDGSAVVFPGVLCSDVANANCANQAGGFVVIGKVDLYNVGSGTWSTLATMPRIGTTPNNYYYSLADAPAAVLPDGNVLFAASPDYQAFVAPTHFFELNFGSNTITQVADTADAATSGAFTQNFLLLPTGQVLAMGQVSGNFQIYTPLAGNSQPSWIPVIASAPSCVTPGGTYFASGTQLNGLTEGSYYGDDVQAAVNFPVIRIVNISTGHVFYAKTFNHSTRSITPGATVSTAFTVSNATETGPSTLYDVGAGIPSVGTSITVSSACAQTFAITVSASPPAGGTVSGGGTFPSGSTQTVTAAPNSGFGFINWTENNSVVSSSPSYTFTLSANRNLVANFVQGPILTATHDFNGDGKSDILWRDSAGDVGFWLMNGGQILQVAAFNAVHTNWSIVGQRDFNGDGKSDILWRDTVGDVGLWLMNGTQIVQGGSFGAIPLNWSVAGTGDFNGDGNADILWIDNQGNVTIWFMNGMQILQAGVVGQLPPNWIIVGSDMKGDIFLRNTSSGDVGMWVMNGSQIAQAVDFGPVPLNWTVAGIGDFDGNGSFDLLWRDTARRRCDLADERH